LRSSQRAIALGVWIGLFAAGACAQEAELPHDCAELAAHLRALDDATSELLGRLTEARRRAEELRDRLDPLRFATIVLVLEEQERNMRDESNRVRELLLECSGSTGQR
jgi:predicted nuclease with TOPRIM domain